MPKTNFYRQYTLLDFSGSSKPKTNLIGTPGLCLSPHIQTATRAEQQYIKTILQKMATQTELFWKVSPMPSANIVITRKKVSQNA